MPLKPSYLLLVGGGAIIAYSGFKGKGVGSAIRSVLQGHSPGDALAANQIGSANVGSQSANIGSRFSGSVPPGTIGRAGGPDTISPPAANRLIGKSMAMAYGWGIGAEWKALDYGWGTLESGWNNRIYYGGQVGGPYQPGLAYGIPAFLGHGPNGAPFPAGKQTIAANPPGAGGRSWPPSQIAQGLAYIKGRYGSPTQVPGWTGGPYHGY